MITSAQLRRIASGYRVRREPGRMNGTESLYWVHLRGLEGVGSIAWYAFEPIKLRLADATFYTPDFAVMLADGTVEFHEVKGFWQDDARVKIKVAAEQYWMFRFWAVTPERKKDGGGWKTEGFNQ